MRGNDSTVIFMLSNGYRRPSNIPPHPRPDCIGAPISTRRGSFETDSFGRDEDINPPPLRSEQIGIQYLDFRLSGIRKPVRSIDTKTTVSFDFLKRCER